MANLEIRELKGQEWTDILKKWGDGKVYDKFGEAQDYKTDCTDDKWPGHHVVHGEHTELGGLTDTGFLRNQTGQVVKGVIGIPT